MKDEYFTPHRRICLYLLLFVSLMLVTDALFSLGEYGVPYIKMAGSLLIPAAAVIALYLWRRKPDIRTFFRLERIGLSEALLWFFFGLCANCAGAVLNIPLNLFLNQFIDIPPGIPTPQSFLDYLLGVFCVAAVPALCEEALCRGIVLREYEQYGRRFAVWASAIAFSLLHNTITNLLFTLLLGLVLALIVTRTKSIYPAVIFHFAINFFSITMSYITQELIAPHMQPALSLALNLTYACMALVFVFSFFLFLKTTRPDTALKAGTARPKLGFSFAMAALLIWFGYSQIQLFL